MTNKKSQSSAWFLALFRVVRRLACSPPFLSIGCSRLSSSIVFLFFPLLPPCFLVVRMEGQTIKKSTNSHSTQRQYAGISSSRFSTVSVILSSLARSLRSISIYSTVLYCTVRMLSIRVAAGRMQSVLTMRKTLAAHHPRRLAENMVACSSAKSSLHYYRYFFPVC